MQFPLSPLVIAFVAVLALWPLAFLVAAACHVFAKRWQRVSRVAWLLPLWMLAASIGLLQLPSLLAALDASSPPRSPIMPAVAIAFSLFCAILAWALLFASFGGRGSSPSGGQARQQ
jgi:hypothetical protein